MSKYGSKFWDERYSAKEYVYGTDPNKFFKEQIDRIPPGKILLLGEGEGRNAVYAAKRGWQVDAFDFSERAKAKAVKLAKKSGVKINYTIQDLIKFNPSRENYNAAAIIFLHLGPEYRKRLHQKITESISDDGTLIMEVYEKDQIDKSSGGPQDPELLYSLKEIETDFSGLRTILLKKQIVILDESEEHRGVASVIRYVGKKQNKES